MPFSTKPALIRPLKEGISDILLPEQPHQFQLELQKDEALQLHVMQEGVDLTIRVVDHEHDLTIDSRFGPYGNEVLYFVAPNKGLYTFEVTTLSKHQGGQYHISRVLQQAGDKQAFENYNALIALFKYKDFDTFAKYAQANKNPYFKGTFAYRKALEIHRTQPLEAITHFDQAAHDFQEAGFLIRASRALMEAGALCLPEDLQSGYTYFQQAQDLARAVGNIDLADHYQCALGQNLSRKGLFQDAIATYTTVLNSRRFRSDAISTRARQGIAKAYRATGRNKEALDNYNKALIYWNRIGNQEAALRIRNEISTTLLFQETNPLENNNGLTRLEAIGKLKAILKELKNLDDSSISDKATKQITAGAADRLGTAYREFKRFEEAEEAYQQALRAVNPKSKVNTANIRANLADLYLQWGKYNQSIEEANKSFELYDEYRNAFLQAHVSMIKALAQQELGQGKNALVALESAMEVINKTAQSPGYHRQRRHFTHTHFYFHLRYADLLLETYFSTKENRFQEQAFQVLEEVRAQDLLARLLDYNPQLQSIPPPATIKQIQEDLLNPETNLIAYTLGEQRSYAWVITQSKATPIFLGSARNIQIAADKVNSSLKNAGGYADSQTSLRSSQLSKAIFEPLLPHITGKRILLLKDQFLHKTAFAALPHPSSDSVLGQDYRFITLPSATIGLLLKSRPPLQAEHPMLVIADPIYQANDKRRPYPSGTKANDEPRLPYTAQEANYLQEQLKLSDEHVLLGLRATRSAFKSKVQNPYQIIHLAMHGKLDKDNPENSGLLFSTYGREGRLEGLLQANQLGRLKLHSELVTLSACDTALGRTWKGHGVWNLGHDFIAAGSRRALVSLWRVEDGHTARLMELFYDQLLNHKVAPDLALAHAQNTMRQEQSDPYFWAAFTLLGDWTSFLQK